MLSAHSLLRLTRGKSRMLVMQTAIALTGPTSIALDLSSTD